MVRCVIPSLLSGQALSTAKDLSPGTMQILRCAQDDNPSSASFDSHNAFFEMYWSLSWSYERLSLPPGATQASPPHALIHPRPYGKTAVLRP